MLLVGAESGVLRDICMFLHTSYSEIFRPADNAEHSFRHLIAFHLGVLFVDRAVANTPLQTVVALLPTRSPHRTTLLPALRTAPETP